MNVDTPAPASVVPATANMSEPERRMRRFTCRTCASAPGDPCLTVTGRVASTTHAARWYSACSAGLLPVQEAPTP